MVLKHNHRLPRLRQGLNLNILVILDPVDLLVVASVLSYFTLLPHPVLPPCLIFVSRFPFIAVKSLVYRTTKGSIAYKRSKNKEKAVSRL